MPNWCEGNMRLRGRPEAIADFLKNEISCIGRTKTLDTVEAEPKFTNDGYECIIEMPDVVLETMHGWRSFYIKGTRRNFFEGQEKIYVDIDDDEDITVSFVDGFKAAWAIDPAPYVAKSKKYGVDIKIFGFEKGMQFMQLVEVVNGELMRNDEITFDDWRWECPMPHMGG